jgi:hypothetical protein
MTNDKSIEKGKSLLAELSEVCRNISDTDILRLFDGGSIDEFLNAIINPSKAKEFPCIGDFFLTNKNRAMLMAALRRAITTSCSFKVTKDGITAYVSPNDIQWFDDGIILLEGKQPFEGLLTLYRNGRSSYAMVVRDIAKGEEIGPDDLEFADVEETRKYFEQLKPPTEHELDIPVNELSGLLRANDPDESKYQKLFIRHPWVLGLQYKKIQRHEPLDDQNIPDFTGVKVNDGCRDIFELKPPSMDIFRKDGEFSANFNTAWNQAERYLSFCREGKGYLQRKGFLFDNPKCILICGYNLPEECVKKLRVKEKMNPAIQVMTFNDVLAFIKSTVTFIKKSMGNFP